MTVLTTYPLLWLALAFVVGVAGARGVPVPWWGWGVAALVGAVAGWGLRRRWRAGAWAAALVAAAALGGARWQMAQPDWQDPAFVAGYAALDADVTVVGVLTEPPDIRDTYANLRLRVERLRLPSQPAFPAYGLLLVRTSPEEALDLRYGDRVVVSGRLSLPPEGEVFSYRDYLAREGIFAMLDARRLGVMAHGQGSPLLAAIYALRARAHAVVRRLWPDPEAALLAGILLGQDRGIPRRVYDAFRETGTAHIIAISGFNITILAGLFVGLFGRLVGLARGTLLAALAIVAYTILVGADAAVVRAAVMGLLSMAALRLGRSQHAYTTLALTAAVMTALDPAVLGDVGFQLSFAATLGLLLFAEPFQRAAARGLRRWLSPAQAERWAQPLGEFFLFTLAAQLMTLPISAYHFRRVSLISFLANPAVLPVQAPLMVLAGSAVLLGLVWLPLGRPLAWAVWPLAAYTIRTVEAFAHLPLTTVAVTGFGAMGVMLYYGLLAAAVVGWKRAAEVRERLGALRIAKTAALPVLAVLAMLTWHAALARTDRRLQVTLLDVGNGEALLVRSPAGRWLLIDGGERGTALAEALGRTLGASQSLDWWVVGSTRAEALEGLLEILPAYSPRAVWWAGRPTSLVARKLRARLETGKLPLHPVRAGAALDLGEGARLEALSVSPRGGVFLLHWQRFRLLLPLGVDTAGGVLPPAEAIAPVTALLLAGGGYAPLNPPEWVQALTPQVLLLSVRAADPWGRPDLRLLQALQGFSLLRTDRCGAVTLFTDGERMWVQTARPCGR